MTNCSNCGTTITCGCQVRTASNGTQVCNSCISDYEMKLIIVNAPINNPDE
jgi:hypothetical protein